MKRNNRTIRIRTISRKIQQYQHLRCLFWIFIAMVITFVLSLLIKSSPWNGIFSNVFAGLLTGLVVTLINSLKSKEIRDTELERDFLKVLHDQYITASGQYREYRKNRNADADEYFGAVFDLASEMYALDTFIEQEDNNARLIRILGKKPSELFKDAIDYDLKEANQRHKEFAELIDSTIRYDENIRKEIDEKINIIRRVHHNLNHETFILLGMLDEQKIEIETSIP